MVAPAAVTYGDAAGFACIPTPCWGAHQAPTSPVGSAKKNHLALILLPASATGDGGDRNPRSCLPSSCFASVPVSSPRTPFEWLLAAYFLRRHQATSGCAVQMNATGIFIFLFFFLASAPERGLSAPLCLPREGAGPPPVPLPPFEPREPASAN